MIKGFFSSICCVMLSYTLSFLLIFTFRRASSLFNADSKTLKEEKREELFESLKTDKTIGWAVDVIDPKELSAKMLQKSVYNFLQ